MGPKIFEQNNIYHERIKHIDVRLHFAREVEFGEVKIVKVALEENHADVYEVSSNVLTNFSFEDKGR